MGYLGIKSFNPEFSRPSAQRLAAFVLSAWACCAAFQQVPAAGAPQAHLGKGYEALKQEQYEVAASEFRAALRLDPTLVMRARFPLAVALFEMKQSAEARREFEAVRREAGDHPNVAYYLGRLDLMDQNFAGAIQNLSRAITNPPFPDTAYYLGLACFRRGDLASAEKWLKRAVEVNPVDSLAAYQLGQVYRRQGRDEEASQALARSAELRRHDAEVSRLRLECARKLDEGPRDEARAFCQQLYDANNAEKLTMLGTIYGQHGDLEAALEPLRRAAELSPQAPQMQYNLAYTYYRLNRFEEARGPLASAVERWPDIFQLNSLYGAVLLRLGEEAPACQALRRAHQLNPTDTGTSDLLYATLLALGRRSQASHEYSGALRYFDEASELRPADPEPHRYKAEIYRLGGRPAEATTEQQQADGLKQVQKGKQKSQ
ncbi:MAG TPA: tetratricopeptide repeat protein [Terriglobales bacterium]|nr:tetratricopeptide repeat protein [Terriglobales bacterium]